MSAAHITEKAVIHYEVWCELCSYLEEFNDRDDAIKARNAHERGNCRFCYACGSHEPWCERPSR